MTESTMTARAGDRSLFEALDPRAYLNHAAVSPPSRPVREAIEAWTRDYAAEGLGAMAPWMARRNRLRDRLADLVGAAGPDEIGFVQNTSQGVLDVAMCLPWRPGQCVVLFEGEFPTNVTPWQRAAELFDLEILWIEAAAMVDPSGRGLEELESHLRDRDVRLVAASAVQFQTGWRMPLAAMGELAHAHGAELFVDGIQACGAVPLDVDRDRVDYMSCGGHKWLMGVEGTGFLYVRRACLEELEPRLASWLSHTDPIDFLVEGAGHLSYDRPIRRKTDFVEFGAQSAVGLAALGASVELLAGLGVEAIFEHITTYLDALEPRLVALGLESARRESPAARSAILSALPPDGVDLGELADALGRRGVSVATPDGYLRFAPHWPNPLDEVDVVVEATEEALAELR